MFILRVKLRCHPRPHCHLPSGGICNTSAGEREGGREGGREGVIGVRAGQISTMNDSHVGRSERAILRSKSYSQYNL